MRWDEKRPERFALERQLLSKFHPGCKLVKKRDQWRVRKRHRGRRDSYEVELVLPKNFPYGMAKAYLLRPRIKKAPHYFPDMGHWLCLNEREDVTVETTIKVYLDWFVQWVGKYERWLKTGKW